MKIQDLNVLCGDVTVAEARDGLVFRVVKYPSVSSALLDALATGAFTALMTAALFGQTRFLLIGIVTALFAFVLSRRPRTATLTVDKLDLVSTGRVGEGLGLTRSIATAELQGLGFEEDTTGPEDSSHPGGLYAQVGGKSVCLLPGITGQQSAEVIREILRRFPQLREQFSKASGPEDHFCRFVSMIRHNGREARPPDVA